MADKRSEHVVTIGGVEHVFLLTDDDAARYPGAEKKAGASRTLAARQAEATAAAGRAISDGAAPTTKAAPAPANK